MNEANKIGKQEEVIAEEGYVLRPRPRPSEKVTISIPRDTLASIDRVAAHRGMSREALLKLYLGHGLRQDLAQLFSQRLLETTALVLSKHLQSEEEVAAILQEIRTATAAQTSHPTKGATMTTIHAQAIGDQILMPRDEWEQLLTAAQRTEAVAVQLLEDDLPPGEMARLAAQGGAFDFWKEEGEDIYTLEDGEPV